MKRNKFGMSHKVKGSMDFGLVYPVLCQEMVPNDILRCKPEAIVKSVVPPVTALTDKIKWQIEFAFTPDRILDDHFVRNLSTTKSGEVKGDFKTWSLDQIERNYGSASRGYSPLRDFERIIPKNFRERAISDCVTRHGVDKNGSYYNDYTEFDEDFDTTGVLTNTFQESLPYAFVKDSNGKTTGRCAPYFGQGSLLDWLGLEPNGNIGQKSTNDAYFRCAPISAYYMYINFYKTNPEYEKYIAPYFDYVYVGKDNSEGRETLHRYETLEDEFGNEFTEPSLSGRCVNGLVVDNWNSDYFAKTTKDPQRGIAPKVPVSVSGNMYLNSLNNTGVDIPGLKTGISSGSDGSLSAVYLNPETETWTASSSLQPIATTEKGLLDDVDTSISGSFTISDLRTALALQHFQEDIQGTYKWTSFLQRVFGTSPLDTLLDQPKFLGACSGVLSSSEVVAQADTDNATLGEIGGHLSGYGAGKMVTFTAHEHGWFMAFMTIKVERNYESGVERQFTRKNYLDMFFPEFVGIGNQAIRSDELMAVVGSGSRTKNIGFTDRYGEMKHKYNRVVGKCRNDNIVLPMISSGIRNWSTAKSLRSNDYIVPYLNDFHPYAIGDAYVHLGSGESSWKNDALSFDEINQDFLLCCPQLNDIFVDDSEEPFMVVLGFNMDMFRPLPVYTKPGISYV